MTVKEVVLAAATEIGCRTEVEAYYNTGALNGEWKAKRLLECFNLVENELALDYLPLYAEDKIASGTGKIFYKNLTHDAVRIIGVTDSFGAAKKFTLYADHLITLPGTTNVFYTYTPKTKGIDEESDFYLYVSPRLLAYGVVAEYYLALGLITEAGVWDKKYKDAIEALYRSKTNKRIAGRRWV